jgi:hypothetical protein
MGAAFQRAMGGRLPRKRVKELMDGRKKWQLVANEDGLFPGFSQTWTATLRNEKARR